MLGALALMIQITLVYPDPPSKRSLVIIVAAMAFGAGLIYLPQ